MGMAMPRWLDREVTRWTVALTLLLPVALLIGVTLMFIALAIGIWPIE